MLEKVGAPAWGIAERFWARVDDNPSATAILIDDDAGDGSATSISYGELDRWSRRIAASLDRAQAELEPLPVERPIAICMEHGADLVAAILTTVSTARFYVPLDPTYPDERMDTLLALADPAIILVHGPTRERMERMARPDQIVLDLVAHDAPDAEEETVAQRLAPGAGLDVPAYLLFTSGSTGEPKGACHSQGSLLRSVDCYTQDMGVRTHDRIAFVIGASFTPSIFCIFGAFLNGATLCPFDLKRRPVSQLPGWIKDNRITQLYMVPTLFRRLVAELKGAVSLDSLRWVQLAGEPVQPADVTLFRRHFDGHARFYNGLGTAETSCLCRHVITVDSPDEEGPVPVGRPYHDVELLIQDADGDPVGPGDVGELVVRGRHISRGYWRRPDLDADRFEQDPDDPSLILYRSGDLVSRRKDGAIIHHGRGDFQVKIRGQRVELGEIEAHLSDLTGVEEAAVVGVADDRDEIQLVAHVTGQNAQRLGTEVLRRRLGDKVPGHMVPARFVFHDRLPLTGTGKVDRQALMKGSEAQADEPPAEKPAAETGVQVQAAETPVPKKPPAPTPRVLSRKNAPRGRKRRGRRRIKHAPAAFPAVVRSAFSDALGRQEVSGDDDFFVLGGDSLRAVELALALEKELGVPVSPSLVLEAPTADKLAARLLTAEGGSGGLIRLQEGTPDSVPLFCIAGMDGYALTFRQLAHNMDPDTPCYGIDLPGLDGVRRPPYSMEDLIHRMAVQIERVADGRPLALIGYSLGGIVAFELARHFEMRGRPVICVGLIDTFSPSLMKNRLSGEMIRLLGWGRYIAATGARQTMDTVRSKYAARKEHSTKRRTTRPKGPRGRKPEKAYRRILSRYRPTAWPRDVLFFRGTQPPFGLVDCHRQWRRLTNGKLRTVPIDSDHSFMLRGAAALGIAEELRRIIDGPDAFLRALWPMDGAPALEPTTVEAAALPAGERALLVHNGLMTPVLRDHVAGPLDVRILAKQESGDHYVRKVVLEAKETRQQLQMAMLRVALDYFDPEVRQRITDADMPFGAILAEVVSDLRCTPRRYFSVEADAAMKLNLQLDDTGITLYGRHSVIHDVNGKLLAESLEILPPIDREDAD